MSFIWPTISICSSVSLGLGFGFVLVAIRKVYHSSENRGMTEIRMGTGEKDEMFGAKYAAIPRPMRKSTE